MITSRFAPAPTGYLHLGHVANAIYVWGIARALGGRVLLRIEDHDRQRSRPEFEQAILEDLDWLGFMPDTPPTSAFRRGVCEGRQSDRTAIYEGALASLRARGLIYACECSRRDIAAAGSVVDAGETRYPGTCAHKALAEGPGLALRVRLASHVERFVDGRHGPLEQRPSEQCGDLVVRDRDGNWSYQFAVAVDDWRQDVTLVVRGDDVLASTGRQIQLARLLGREVPPRFVHHPLIMRSASQKLSKADSDTSIRDQRSAGLTAADVVGRAAQMVGLLNQRQPFAARQVATLEGISRIAARLRRTAS